MEYEKLKVFWQDAILFVYFSYFIKYIHSFNHTHTIHLSIAIRWGLSQQNCFESGLYVNIVSGNLKSEILKIMPRNLHEILRSKIPLQEDYSKFIGPFGN